MTPEARSRIMSAICKRNTKPELSWIYGIKQNRFRILAQRRWGSQNLYDAPHRTGAEFAPGISGPGIASPLGEENRDAFFGRRCRTCARFLAGRLL